MTVLIFLFSFTIICLILSVIFVYNKNLNDGSFFIVTSMFFILISIIQLNNYSTKAIPEFVYRTDSHKIYQYKCNDEISVNQLKKSDDLFYLPESMLIVRCSGELVRK